ncbi:transporter substrate-binding domain-containing protein [Arsenicitalea aurantiaca]|uniref:Transporter substrate-binding domain-containing protein n=1 Tax=Arsenicitalea aurantiaca TaxID=1783274 RepID=A0A433XAG2_9HYPH|nr:transporter substrate-binding domain-containing protein [Arsenicitalea aurantiaca]RUT31059.1 transporter substrate-binding domain-containing protein [Arsenicitalea aurantiaca]
MPLGINAAIAACRSAILPMAIGLAALLPPGAATGQDVQYIPRDMYVERLQREGNAITFCYNADGMMAGFELDLARAIGDALLVEVSTRPIPGTQITTPPLDHRLPLLPDQLFVLLAEDCSALLGYALSSSNPEWLSVTRPYFSSDTLLVVADPEYRTLDDVPLDRPVGARGMSMADNRLIMYLQARSADRRWHRHPYFNNEVVLERLADGTIGAGLVWAPALYVHTDGDPEAAGFHVISPMPFPTPQVEIGIATRSDNSYLNVTLGAAIQQLLDEGTIADLLARHRLVPADPDR